MAFVAWTRVAGGDGQQVCHRPRTRISSVFTMSLLPRLALGLVGFLPTSLVAQQPLRGVVRDSATGLPVAQVEVAVDNARPSVVTGTDGRFRLDLEAGSYLLHFRRIGYAPQSRRIQLLAGTPLAMEVLLVAQAQVLDSVVTAARPDRFWPPGMDDRMREGFGRFVTDSTLRQFDHSTLSSALLAAVPTVRFERIQGRMVAVSRRSGAMAGGGICPLAIWVDGVQIWAPSVTSGWQPPMRTSNASQNLPPNLDQYQVAMMGAVEVYTAANVPSQYRSSGSACGVLLLWTKRN